MEFQAPPPSFIPKRNIATQAMQHRAPMGILMFVAVAIFLASLLAAGAVFYMNESAAKNVQSLNTQIKKASDQYKRDTLDTLTLYDLKTKVAQELLDKHTSMLPIFNFLEGLTLSTVRFKTFKFATTDDGKIGIKMSGEAKNYTSIALQANEFAKAKNISDMLFTDLNLDQQGNVIFNFSANLDPKFISYRDTHAIGL